MTSHELNTLSNRQLAKRYTDLSNDQFTAKLRNDTGMVRRLAKALFEVSQALKSRGGDSWKVLLPLLENANAQVRLNSARTLLDLAPDQATATLQELARSAPSAQRGAAGMVLYYRESGISQAIATSRQGRKTP